MTMLEKMARTHCLRRAEIEPDHPRHVEWWALHGPAAREEFQKCMAEALKVLLTPNEAIEKAWTGAGIDMDPHDYHAVMIAAVLTEKPT